MRIDWRDMARLRDGDAFGFRNAGWNLDAYPDAPTLKAGAELVLADIAGPAVVTHLHMTQLTVAPAQQSRLLEPASVLDGLRTRGLVLEVCYNGMAEPAVRVPMADFFCDGCGGQARTFSSPCVEKAPHAYNCFIPMPFEGQCRIVLRNETPVDLLNYAFVEWERLPQWDPSLGYFHAAWRRWAFQLSGDTDEPFFHVDGRGHLIGRHWSITTDDPLFQGCHFVMEGNNEVRIDGDAEPRADYLGSEDSFTFSWGWPELFEGRWAGINHVREKAPTELSTYRFLGHNAIPFNTSLDWRVDWTHEFPGNPFHDLLARRMADGGAWVDYATTHYWYQERPGYPHAPLPPLADRIRPVLHANPPYEPQLP